MQKISLHELAKAIEGKQCTPPHNEPHLAKIQELCSLLPTGSGIDNGMRLSDSSTPDKIIFEFEFHHLNEDSYYTGWTYHKLILTPSFAHKFNLGIVGRNKNDIKDYLGTMFMEYFD